MKEDFTHVYCLVKTDDATYCGSVYFYQDEEPNWSPKKVLLFSAMKIYSKSKIQLQKINKGLDADIRVKYIDEVYLPDVKEILVASDKVIDELYDRVMC